jgi:hypothetical protein
VKSAKLLISFIEYCATHPDQRFWQALRNWAGVGFVCVSDQPVASTGYVVDTFYSENRDPILSKD